MQDVQWGEYLFFSHQSPTKLNLSLPLDHPKSSLGLVWQSPKSPSHKTAEQRVSGDEMAKKLGGRCAHGSWWLQHGVRERRHEVPEGAGWMVIASPNLQEKTLHGQVFGLLGWNVGVARGCPNQILELFFFFFFVFFFFFFFT